MFIYHRVSVGLAQHLSIYHIDLHENLLAAPWLRVKYPLLVTQKGQYLEFLAGPSKLEHSWWMISLLYLSDKTNPSDFFELFFQILLLYFFFFYFLAFQSDATHGGFSECLAVPTWPRLMLP